ncbi:hypothetical protein AVEN_233171-1 [Araneus ventricosus]|uniref:Uncharacterized protein n=1 Tax=Araneus ventricosus TaxID=182803 RepID=A0A4Y2EK17_ARAVE|nr:hypothetical protein AVEN_233171-1 [Araneus ventricosus]
MSKTTCELVAPSPSFRATQPRGPLECYVRSGPIHTADLRWDRVSNLEPSGSDLTAMPLRPLNMTKGRKLITVELTTAKCKRIGFLPANPGSRE